MQRYRQALLDQPVLHTPRLILRAPAEPDIPAIVAIAGDWQVASRLTRMPHPYREADALFFLSTIAPAELVWMIVERSSNLVVGSISIAQLEDASGAVELGYYVAREHWGRGVATEAGSVILAYGIGLFGRTWIKSGYFIDNPASGRVLEKLGFRQKGLSERPSLAVGTLKPSIEMNLEGEERAVR
ncbi:MAG TPA: GNAT family N-acetyltransferase [Allosphingosinicella sp.]|jgi:RimJ/RimL family protein N-acetyltransferase